MNIYRSRKNAKYYKQSKVINDNEYFPYLWRQKTTLYYTE